ncbi:MAG: hypothetical protein ACYDDZ_01605 [Acidimicrobiales bacterium]
MERCHPGCRTCSDHRSRPGAGADSRQAVRQGHRCDGAAQLALELEEIAGATHQSAVSSVKASSSVNASSAVKVSSSVKVAASIEPVELQHAAILLFVLGKYPVPNAFNPLTGARPVSDYTG